VTGKIFKTKS